MRPASHPRPWPPLVVAYALAGHARLDVTRDVLAVAPDGRSVHLAELWPSQAEIAAAVAAGTVPTDVPEAFDAADGSGPWAALDAPGGATYAEAGLPVVLVAGDRYGTGSSRYWAAKGAQLLGVRAVLANSFERIHRANLVCMGVLPLQLPDGWRPGTIGLCPGDTLSLGWSLATLSPRCALPVTLHRAAGGEAIHGMATALLDTAREVALVQDPCGRHHPDDPCPSAGNLGMSSRLRRCRLKRRRRDTNIAHWIDSVQPARHA